VTKIVDPIEREIDFVPTRVCDPRHMIAGKKEKGIWWFFFKTGLHFLRFLVRYSPSDACERVDELRMFGVHAPSSEHS
jgi:hypothetical protein